MANETRVAELILRLNDQVSGNATKIERSLGSLETSLSSVGRMFAGLFAGTFAAGALLGFGKSVVDVADQIADLSKRTGASGQVLSGLKPILEQEGSSLETFAKGINIAQRNLGQVTEEGDTAALAVKALGLSLDELRNATTDKFIELIANALGKVENPIRRSALAYQLLGRSSAELVPPLLAIAGHFEELRKNGMSDEDIKRLKDFADNLTRVGNSLQVLAAAPLAKLAALFTVLRGAPLPEIDQLNGELEGLQRGLKNLEATRSSLLGKLLGTEDLDKEMADLKGAIKEKESLLSSARAKAAAVKPPPTFVPLPSKANVEETKRLLAEGMKDMFAGIDEAETKAIAGGQDLIAVFGELDTAAMTPLESTIGEINKRFDEMKMKASLAFEATGQEASGALKRLEFLRRQALLGAEKPSTPGDLLDAEEGKRFADAEKRNLELGGSIASLRDELTLIDQEAVLFGASFDAVGAKIGVVKNQITELLKMPRTDLVSDELARLKTQLDGLANLQAFQNAFDSAFSSISQMLQGVFQGTQTVGEGIKNIFRNVALSISESLLKMGLDPLKAKLSGLLQENFPSIFGGSSALSTGGAGATLQSGAMQFQSAVTQFAAAVSAMPGAALGGLFGAGGAPAGVEGPLMQNGGFFSGAGGGFDLSSIFSSITDKLSSMMSGLMDMLTSAFSGLGDMFSSMFSGIGSFIMGIFDTGGFVGIGGLPSFASGGAVPIMAHPGEYVLSSPAVRKLGRGAVMEMNQTGRPPKGAGGSNVRVQINGDIIPRTPGMTPDQVIKVFVNDYKQIGGQTRQVINSDRGGRR